ncbi:MAG TPA: hypothetical protein VFA39_19985 [Steroidobacteraceae bacterium]|nr:hypothetical protein [Steroidobacteraceae bacterium]
MTLQTQILRPTIDALGTLLEDIGGLARGEAAYSDGPRAVVVPPLEAISRLTACLDLLPTALLDPAGPTELELDFSAHEIREAGLIFAAPSRYVRIAEKLEALAYTVGARRAETMRVFQELPPEWQELGRHSRRYPDFSNFNLQKEIRSHV